AFPGCQAAPPEPSQPDEPNLSLAAKVFELLTALDPGNRLRKAPPIKVFLLHFRQNLSRSQIARVCGCSRTLVAERLRSIREKLPWQPHQLRDLLAPERWRFSRTLPFSAVVCAIGILFY